MMPTEIKSKVDRLCGILGIFGGSQKLLKTRNRGDVIVTCRPGRLDSLILDLLQDEDQGPAYPRKGGGI